MKKFISMVMAASMVVSLVPATAFALDGEVAVAAKVLKAAEVNESKTDIDLGATLNNDVPELRIKATEVDWKATEDKDSSVDFKVTLDNAKWNVADEDDFEALVTVVCDELRQSATGATVANAITNFEMNEDKDTIEFTFTHYNEDGEVCAWHEDDVMYIDLDATMTKTKSGAQATVSVKASDLDLNEKDLVFATVVEKALSVELDDEVVDIAVEETAVLDDIVVEPAEGSNFWSVLKNPSEITLKLNKGFEFVTAGDVDYEDTVANEPGSQVPTITDDDEITLTMKGWELNAKEITFSNIKIEATTAKEGDVAVITVKGTGLDSVKVEVAKVCDYKVVMSVDEDEDVPVFYSGVNVKNEGLTVDDDHKALEVTIEETFAGAWGHHKGFTLTLPEGVYVTAVDAEDENTTLEWAAEDDIDTVFEKAYIEGDHVFFDFDKRVFNETDPDDHDPHEITFVLELVADPGFVGDVVLTLEGDAVDTQEVTIAKFVAPMTIKAEQNDLKIDYRYTEVPTDIVVTEAEAGLWAENLKVGFKVDRGDMINFEDEATFTVNEESDMEVDDFTIEEAGIMGFVVEEESDEEAAVVTISDIELFMQRNIPAGPYDLDLYYGVVSYDEKEEVLVGLYDSITLLGQTGVNACKHDDCDTIDDVCDYSTTVKEAWINVVTAGREADDASFTTKVVVPVGEAYIIAGEAQVALDVPAYVNAAGYTMLPVRAVAVALGINTQNVLWDQATKTVTILYGQRIITMQVGAKVVYVNGSAIPASASVEIVDGRTFLPMRDLATALGVTDITWDAATKTATLNGNA